MKVRDLSSKNKVEAEGIVCWPVADTNGNTKIIELPGLHLPAAGIRLLSPQVLKHRHNIGGSIEDDGIHLHGANTTMIAKYNPVSHLSELELVDMPRKNSVWNDAFQDVSTAQDDPTTFLSVVHPDNHNLSPSEKELLLWHQRLSHTSISKVQLMCKKRQWVQVTPSAEDTLDTDPILPTKHSATERVKSANIKCASCCMGKQGCRPTTSTARPSSTDDVMKLKANHLIPGECVSVDHYMSPVRGRRLSGFAQTTNTNGYVGGSLYVDHASGKIFHYPQSELSSSTTVHAKQTLEAAAKEMNISIKSYHADNGIFASQEFKNHCKSQKQTATFSGVGAHHQNGVAERGIGTITRMARANLLHLMLHWPTKCKVNLWALAMEYAVWIYNRVPRDSLGGLTPDEFWSSTRTDHSDIKRAHVFGCPVYVLDPKLQDGKSIPKWNSRSRQGMFIGFSPEHSSMVPLVLNLETGHISPQFHVVFDDHFHTVSSLQSTDMIDDIFNSLYDNGKGKAYESFLDPDKESEGDRVDSTVDDDLEECPMGNPFYSPEGAIPLTNCDIELESSDDNAPNEFDLHDFDPPPEDAHSTTSPPQRPQRSVHARRKPTRFGFSLLPLTSHLSGMEHLDSWAQPPAMCANIAKLPTTYQAKATIQRRELAEHRLLHSSWSEVASAFTAGFCGSQLILPWDEEKDTPMDLYNAVVAQTNALLSPDLSPLTSPDEKLIHHIQPHALAAKTRGNPEDNPSYDQAMSGVHAADYYKAAELELKTLQQDLGCWEIVRRTNNMHILPSTWAFKCKRYPDGRIKKFKARFCARGDRQLEGVDYFETWSPVVQWRTVRLMMIISSMLGLKSAQADITAAFVHADIEEDVFIHQPRGFKVDMNNGFEYVLKLKKSLYGLRQSPRNFFGYLSDHLQKHGLKPSNCEPCLFIGKDVIVIVYVDDLLLYSTTDKAIDDLIAKLKQDKIWIRKEASTEGFLGVDISARKPDGSFTLTQTGLITRVIDALGLHAAWTGSKETPADASPLPKDADGTPADPLVNYASVVGMLLYLSGHTRPDIAFAVSQCARYTFRPTNRHVTALKRIGRYLKGTRSQGIILRPSKFLHVDCYPDADFAGLYNHEDVQDPH